MYAYVYVNTFDSVCGSATLNMVMILCFASHGSTKTGECELLTFSFSEITGFISPPLSMISCVKGSGNFVLSAGLL